MKWLLLFLCCYVPLQAQQLTLKTSEPIEMDQFIGVDSYQHTYYIKEGVLHKKGSLGEFVFQDYQLGPIAHVDIINPLNVVVFYAEVNTVVFLDNRLNETERVNFNTLSNFINVGAATNAGNNRLWLFNTDTQQLQLFDYRTQRETVFSQPYEGIPKAVVSNFNDCYLLTEDRIWQVNIYGSLLSEKALEGYEKLVRNGDSLIGLKENQLYWITQEAVSPLEFQLAENQIKDLQLTKEFLYIYDGKLLYSLTLTQPKK
ncbi:hypothetical protein POV27_04635 [Aureisphaera galaxeae]|uniref:hypothetical protein n=1 Tax=Aureisphaera galaxeae TaxID=1538023 RepID=UPI00234FCD89|nr:hypothetical protein [Aureisphaera galaxeae]MDC8003323.1 hypothetical protein [Aureisphaera galaxeae]